MLCDVLRSTNREKVQRIILATFRVSKKKNHYGIEAVSNYVHMCALTNISVEFIGKAVFSDSGELVYAAEMIHFKSVPVLNVLIKQNREDADNQDDVTFLHEKLNASLQDLRYILCIMVIRNRYMYMYNKVL